LNVGRELNGAQVVLSLALLLQQLQQQQQLRHRSAFLQVDAVVVVVGGGQAAAVNPVLLPEQLDWHFFRLQRSSISSSMDGRLKKTT
jgi:hypothetical protein